MQVKKKKANKQIKKAKIGEEKKKTGDKKKIRKKK